MNEHTIQLRGTRLRFDEYADTNAGVPMLLLHPWFGCHQMWRPFAENADRHALAVDWYSLSECDWAAWSSPEMMAQAAVAVLDETGHERADVIGNSVGGIVAQLIAAQHPDRVRRLVLVGTGATLGGRPTGFGAMVAEWLAHPSRRPDLTARLVQALVARPLAPAELAEFVATVEAAEPDFIGAVLENARGLDLRPLLAHIAAPTLVIRGQHDTARTRAHVTELLAGIADSTAVEMPGCGHSPMIEDVAGFTALVLGHLA